MLRNPAERHLRQWYVLADLYERAGDIPWAREYFECGRRADPTAYDVSDRLHGLGPQRRSGRPGPKRPTKKPSLKNRPNRPKRPDARPSRYGAGGGVVQLLW